jgi:hypothetical protein
VRYRFLGGPFNTDASFFTAYFLHLPTDVFRVTIGDGTGWTRRGFVRVGYKGLGRALPIVESAIRWDDAPSGQLSAETTKPTQQTDGMKRAILAGGVLAIPLILVATFWLKWLDGFDAIGLIGLDVLILFSLNARQLGRLVAVLMGRDR